MAKNLESMIWPLALVLLVNYGFVHGSNLAISSEPIDKPDLLVNNNNETEPLAGGVAPIHIDIMREVRSSPNKGQPQLSYYGTVGIGTPPQQFNILFDAGYDDIWVPMVSGNHHDDWNSFDCSKSKTCTQIAQTYRITYRNVDLVARRHEDMFTLHQDIRVNSVSSRRMPFKQNFLAITSGVEGVLRGKPYDGVIGLSRRPKSSTGTKNILLSIFGDPNEWKQQTGRVKQWGELEPQPQPQTHNASIFDRHHAGRMNSSRTQRATRRFGFWLNRSPDSGFAGRLTLGGVDSEYIVSEFTYHRLIGNKDWELKIDKVQFGKKTVSCPMGCSAFLDTAANSIVGPSKDVQAIYKALGARHQSGTWFVDCDRGSDPSNNHVLSFSIDERDYVISSDVYVRPIPNDHTRCYLAIKPQNEFGSKWILGTSFIGQWYTVFDYDDQRIGFAEVRP